MTRSTGCIRGEGRPRLEAAVADCYRHERRPLTVETVSSRAHVSVGNLYHHFPNGVGELLATVYLKTRLRCDDDLLRELAAHRSLQAGIHAAVQSHLEWIGGHQSRAFCLLTYSPAWLTDANRETLMDAGDEFEHRANAWYTRHVDGGQARPLPHSIYWAAIFGPARAHARAILAGTGAGGVPTALRQTRSALATGASLAVATR
jgi:AcrR family transcriptional regulator